MDTDRLAKIRARLGQVKLRSSGLAYFKVKVGTNTVRVLEGVGDMDVAWWQETSRHRPPGSTKIFTCPLITIEQRCPICELISELRSAGDVESVKLAESLYGRKEWWMNVIDRSNEAQGVQILTAGERIYGPIFAIANDPRYGDISGRNDGNDMVIQRVGTGKYDTRYTVFALPISPLGEATKVKEWLETAMDLAPVLLTDDPAEDAGLTRDDQNNLLRPVAVMSYQRLKAEFEGIDLTSVPAPDAPDVRRAKAEQLDEDVPFGEDEEVAPAPTPVTRRATTADTQSIIRRPRRVS